MHPSYGILTELNPQLKNLTNDELDELIVAIKSCGYEWNETINEFYNPVLNKGIKTSGLDIFTPESFVRTYKSAWSDPNWLGLKKYAPKFYKTSLLTLIVVIISFIFLRWEYALSISGILIAYSSYLYLKWQHFLKIRNKEKIDQKKKDGTFIDRSKIEWCLTCVHFKKVRKYEDRLNISHEMLPLNKIPCKISNETKPIWEEHFSTEADNRYLYPKNCKKWEHK